MSIVPEPIHYKFLPIPLTLAMTWIVWLIILVTSLIARYKFKPVPGTLQNVIELILNFVYDLANTTLGQEARKYYPLFAGIFIFILISNLIGLIPGFTSPTSDLHVTITLALTVFIYYNYVGIRKHGILGYLKHFMGPKLPWYLVPVNALMFVIEIISHIARPFSLAIRLYCNIFAKEALLGFLALLMTIFLNDPTLFTKALAIVPLLLRPLIVLLGIMVGVIQAFIFLVLTIVYIAGATAAEEH
ncbi:MAG: F0F1 ATP synthase subunit A [Elusimicrobiota bacterium]